MDINLSGVQQTLFLPLWSRAKLTKENSPILKDSKAVEVVDQLDYDFSRIEKYVPYVNHLMNVVRAASFDETIKQYLSKYPKASVVNLGAGLDTSFFRVDNGLLNWYDIDLPRVIEIRKHFIPETERMHLINESIFETKWYNRISKSTDGLIFISGGVLQYFEKRTVKTFILNLFNQFPECEIIFDSVSRIVKYFANFNLNKIGMKAADTRWTIINGKQILKWDSRIIILDEYPIFSRIKIEESWQRSVIRMVKLINRYRMINIFHLRYNTKKIQNMG
jgi:O-methyltransferase involved in polyketide biosynthesis